MRILNVTFADPANYPPTINACRVQSRLGNIVMLIGCYRGVHAEFVAGYGIEEVYANDAPGGFHSNALLRVAELLRFRRFTKRVARSFRPDVIVGYDIHGFWAARSALPSAKVVMHLHDLPPVAGERPEGWTDGWIRRVVSKHINNAAALIVPEPTRLRILSAAWNVQIPKFAVANCARQSPEKAANGGDDIRALLSLGADAIVARLGGGGEAHLERETILALRYLRPGIHLALIGCGTEKYREELRTLAVVTGVASRVHLLPYIRYDAVHALLLGASVGLAIYRRGGSDLNKIWAARASGKFMEYLAAGVPIVANSTPDFLDLARDCGGVVHVRSEAPEDIASAIREILSDPSVRQRLSLELLSSHSRVFNYERQYAPVMLHLTKCALGKNPRAKLYSICSSPAAAGYGQNE